MMNRFVDLFYQFHTEKYPFLGDDGLERYVGAKFAVGEPVFGARMGFNESAALRAVEFGYKDKYEKCLPFLCNGAGFFPADSSLLTKYYEIYIDAIRQADIACPVNEKEQAYFYKKYGKKDLVYAQQLSWAGYEKPWAMHMKGKKMLVISPFAESIEKQYARIDQVFPTLEVFPKPMELEAMKAVQTIAGEVDDRFKNWFEALEYMCSETDKRTFDLAIIACGAYGMPLGAHIRKSGRSAMVLGGGLQGHFGIVGKRWEGNDFYEKYRNEYWVHPSESETPKSFQSVEDGCYW